MLKIKFILLILIYISSSAIAATYYVSDNLHTFLHSGPSTKYKIIGSVNAGDHLTLIRKSTAFTLVKDTKGRSGWINSKFVSKQQGLKERFPKLENKLSKLKKQLSEYKNNLDLGLNKIDKLENTNLKLKEELEDIKLKNTSLNVKLDTRENDLLMTWFSYGGMVGGIGLILGLIIPVLIPSRRNKNRW